MDFVAALRCWPVEIQFGDDVYTIPALPASVWIPAMTGDALDIIPGLLSPADEEFLSTALVLGDIADDELVTVVRDAIEAASGYRWWEAERLVGALAANPWLTGRLIADGFDFERRSLGALCVAVYATIMAGQDEAGRKKFDFDLSAPPVEVLRDDPETEAAMFMAALAAQGAPPAS